MRAKADRERSRKSKVPGMAERWRDATLDARTQHAGTDEIRERDGCPRARRDAPFVRFDAGLARLADLAQPALSVVTIRGHVLFAQRPPAMAGTMLISSVVLSCVSRPSRKRMSSSPT